MSNLESFGIGINVSDIEKNIEDGTINKEMGKILLDYKNNIEGSINGDQNLIKNIDAEHDDLSDYYDYPEWDADTEIIKLHNAKPYALSPEELNFIVKETNKELEKANQEDIENYLEFGFEN